MSPLDDHYINMSPLDDHVYKSGTALRLFIAAFTTLPVRLVIYCLLALSCNSVLCAKFVKIEVRLG